MAVILGIESTAHTFGIGIVKNGKIIANIKDMYTTDKGGIIPIESAKHHSIKKHEVYFKALAEAGIKEQDIDAIAFSGGIGEASKPVRKKILSYLKFLPKFKVFVFKSNEEKIILKEAINVIKEKNGRRI